MRSKIFFLIILLSFVLRFFQLGINPASLDWDEASLGYNAYSIIKTARDEYGNFLPASIRSFNDYKPPLYTYLTVLPVLFFGLTEFATRFASGIFGIIAVAATYYLTKHLFGKTKPALLASLLLAVSPWHLQFSRTAFEANIALTLVILGSLFFIKGLRRPTGFYFSATFFGLSIFAYHSPRLLVPVIIAGLFLIYVRELRKSLGNISIFLLILSLFYLPVIREFTSTGARFSSVSVINPDEKLGQSIKAIDFDITRGDLLGKFFHNRRIVYAREILAGYLDHFDFDFLFLSGDAPGRHHAPGIGMLQFYEFPFVVVGVIFLLKKYREKSIQTLFLLFLTSPLASSLTSGTPHAVRAIFYLPIFQIFTAFGILYLIDFLKNNKFAKNIIYINFSVCILLLANFFYYLHQYYIHAPREYALDWQYGYKQAVNIANLYYSSVDKIIFTYKYDQPYVYFLFYNKIDPAWYQKNWGEGEIKRGERRFDKYEFRNIDWEKDKNMSNVLIVGTPQEIPEGVKGQVAEISFPDGSVAFRLVLR